MRLPRFALAAALALLGTLTAACQPAEPDTPTATIAAPTIPTPPATPEPPLPSPSPSPTDYTIPEVIDAPYVQRVLQALYNKEFQAVQESVEAGEVTESATQLLRSVNSSSSYDRQLMILEASAAGGFRDVLRPPGNPGFMIEELLSASPACAFVRGTRDFSVVAVDPGPVTGTTFVQLIPMPADQPFRELNPTPWVIGGSLLRTDDSGPEDPCVS